MSTHAHVCDHSPRDCYDLDFMFILQRFEPDLVGLDTLVLCSLQQAVQRYTRSDHTIISAMARDSEEHGHELGIRAWLIAEVFVNHSLGNYMRFIGRKNIFTTEAARDCIPMG